jgi:toxin ParE1/3/4
MKVHWTETAEGHLDAIHAYIAQDSPEYAKRIVDRRTRKSQPEPHSSSSGGSFV